ncbi:MAG: 3-oxoacyl-[acyl-carrier protein] reductase [Candidatus Sumerlaeota bacterium]|nr:3-oxoacyl-[acyl-carrier protein] reductase [Candidatus Sumerlaeota bacterium]
MASKKRVALVTGSGAGIGRAVALQLARDGYLVVVNSRSADPAITDRGAGEVKATIEREGGEADIVRADVSSAQDRQRLLDTIDERHGRLDLLVNNAGVAPNVRADILDAGEESFDRLIGINLKGPYFLTQLAAKRMIGYKQAGVVEKARIAFVTSISSFTASVNRGDYCISKAGLSMAASLFADRLGEHDIPVVDIRPGVIATDMTSGVKEKYDALIAGGIFPQRRWGQPEDIARAVSAFARGDLDYSTGAVIDVSGGFNLHRL